MDIGVEALHCREDVAQLFQDWVTLYEAPVPNPKNGHPPFLTGRPRPNKTSPVFSPKPPKK
jgi:hypothetical protein